MVGRSVAAILALLAVLAASPASAAESRGGGPFADWAAVVVAGDWRAHDGGPTEAFDNARRDVAASLVAMGFKAENLTQFSTRPDLYPDTRPERLTAGSMLTTLKTTAERAKGGCLVYYTSHGGPPGVALDVLGKMYTFSPDEMAVLLDEACPGRPTILIVSACFSGVFVPYVSGPQRMIMTAARSDRSSFGCSSEDKYPFFDACFLESVSKVKTFPALPPVVQACVSKRETDMGLAPPSEPQVAIGADVRMRLSMMPFKPAPPPKDAP